MRERREDILYLADRFRCETNAELDKQVADFCADAKAYLLVHDWPGNVRELRNTVRRAVLLSNAVIELEHLRRHWSLQSAPSLALQDEQRDQDRGLHDIIHEAEAVVHLEKALIQHALEQTQNNKKKAAQVLHIGYKTLYRKLKEHGML